MKPMRVKVDRELMRQRLELLSDAERHERSKLIAPFKNCTPETPNLIVFTVFMKRVGADNHEWPVSVIIPKSDEEKYRVYHRSLEWNDWADRNRIYRNVRIEVTSYEG
jgi:hypothetical protein